MIDVSTLSEMFETIHASIDLDQRGRACCKLGHGCLELQLVVKPLSTGDSSFGKVFLLEVIDI